MEREKETETARIKDLHAQELDAARRAAAEETAALERGFAEREAELRKHVDEVVQQSRADGKEGEKRWAGVLELAGR